MARTLDNLKRGFRMIRSQPGLAIMAILTLGLGIGLTTMVFSIVNATIIAGLPFPEPDELVVIRERIERTGGERSVNVWNYVDWRQSQTTFDGLAAFQTQNVNISGSDGLVDRRAATRISANAFDLLGARPLLGRTFSPEEDQRGADAVVVLGYGFWQTRFGGRPGVLGEIVRINGEPHTVIGVMDAGFGFPEFQELWRPLQFEPIETERIGSGSVNVFGRMRDGVGLDAARTDLDLISRRLEAEYPVANAGVRPLLMTFNEWTLGDETIAFIQTLFVAASAVLLIACFNVANLLLARAASRTREMAIRVAVGASRLHIISQMLTEALVLSFAGAVLGLGIGTVGIRWFERNLAAEETPPFWFDFGIDLTILGFVVAITVAAGLIAGILPAIQSSETRVNEVLKDEARGSSSLRMSRVSRLLVSAEVALSFGLLVAAGMTGRSILEVRNFDSSMSDEQVFVASLSLLPDNYDSPVSRDAFWNRLLRDLEAESGIRRAAIMSSMPGLGAPGGRFEIDGQIYAAPEERPLSRWTLVTPGFFDVVGVAALAGRTFENTDVEDAAYPVVVNQNFRRVYFPDEDPVGQRIRVVDDSGPGPWRTIVGIIPNIPIGNISDSDSTTTAGFYMVYRRESVPGGANLAIATNGDALALTGRIREIIRRLDPDLALTGVNTMAGSMSGDLWYIRVLGTMFIAFGLGGLVMAGVGIYSIMAFSVRRKTGEIGIRMTLGASSGHIRRLFLLAGLRQLALGLIGGVALAIALTRGIRMALFNVEPADPGMFVLVGLGLVVVGFLASDVPARRAAALDPVDAIRYD